MWFLYTIWQWFCYVLAAILGSAIAIPVAVSILIFALGASWFMYQYVPMVYRVIRGLYYVKFKGTMPPEYLAAQRAREEAEKAAALEELEQEIQQDGDTPAELEEQ